MKKYDVAALGTMDWLYGKRQNNPIFEANPGGAPCNVLPMLPKLGERRHLAVNKSSYRSWNQCR